MFTTGLNEDRIAVPSCYLLIVQGNLALTYEALGRVEEAMRLRRDVYLGWLQFKGEEHYHSLRESNNYAFSLIDLERFEEAKTLMRKTMPVARRTLGESNDTTLRTRCIYAQAIYRDPAATLDHLRESMTTLEETARTARRVFGGAHPLTAQIERRLPEARAVLGAREGVDLEPLREAVAAMKAAT